MNPAEDGPVVLELFCSRRPDPHALAVVRLRVADSHRVLHARRWDRLAEDLRDAIGDADTIDLDEPAPAPAPPGDHPVGTPGAHALLRAWAFSAGQMPWLFCRCGRNTTATADWLREQTPTRRIGTQPRRVAAP